MDKLTIISDDTEIFKRNIDRELRIEELKKQNYFNPVFVNFYHSGSFTIVDKKIDINRINILNVTINNQEKNIIDFVDNPKPLSKDIKIKSIIKFKDTSLFEQILLRFSDRIVDNNLVFDKEITDFINHLTWDGKYHSLVAETMYLNEMKNI